MKVTRLHNNVAEFTTDFNPVVIAIATKKDAKAYDEFTALDNFATFYSSSDDAKQAKLANKIFNALFSLPGYRGDVITLKKAKQVSRLCEMIEVYQDEAEFISTEDSEILHKLHTKLVAML